MKLKPADLQPGDIVTLDLGYGGGCGPDGPCRVLSVDPNARTLFDTPIVSVRVQILGSDERMTTDYPPNCEVEARRP